MHTYCFIYFFILPKYKPGVVMQPIIPALKGRSRVIKDLGQPGSIETLF